MKDVADNFEAILLCQQKDLSPPPVYETTLSLSSRNQPQRLVEAITKMGK